jgi:hypothetical protein
MCIRVVVPNSVRYFGGRKSIHTFRRTSWIGDRDRSSSFEPFLTCVSFPKAIGAWYGKLQQLQWEPGRCLRHESKNRISYLSQQPSACWRGWQYNIYIDEESCSTPRLPKAPCYPHLFDILPWLESTNAIVFLK